MNPTWTAVRAGLIRGRIELRQALTATQDLLGMLIPAVIFFVVMLFLRGQKVPGADFSLGSMTIPSMIGAGIAFNGLLHVMQVLTVEREDGTLLRAKAIPNGMLGYLIGKIVGVTGTALIGASLTLIPGLLLFPGLALNSVGSWLTLAWVLVLGMVATMPIGAVLGSLFSNPRSMGLIMLPLMGLMGTSGIFYPITRLPEWVQWVSQVFPIYWLGLGMRSAMLPPSMMTVEIGQSWRHWETLGVLGVWAVLGLVLAPIVLRRMARQESGSNMVARRQKAMQRLG